MDELTLSGKTYVSSKRAAEITGYAKDYVGQLCREGHVEARMVGRSWYVLESSIREHRFGKPDEAAAKRASETAGGGENGRKEKSQVDLPATWESPRYSAEPVPLMPPMPLTSDRVGNSVSGYEHPQSPEKASDNLDISDKDQTIFEMQEAWKEWFSARSEPLLESPEVIEEREEMQESRREQEAGLHSVEIREEGAPREEEPVPVAFQKIGAPVPPESAEEPVTIRKFPPRSAPQPFLRKPARARRKQPTNIVASALLIALAALVIAVGFIGSGFASTYVQNNAIVQFLGGTSTIQK